MKVTQVTTAFARNDDEHEFDDLDEVLDIMECELDEESDEEGLLQVTSEEEYVPFVYTDPHTGALRWTRSRKKAVEAITEDGDDADDEDDGDDDSDE